MSRFVNSSDQMHLENQKVCSFSLASRVILLKIRNFSVYQQVVLWILLSKLKKKKLCRKTYSAQNGPLSVFLCDFFFVSYCLRTPVPVPCPDGHNWERPEMTSSVRLVLWNNGYCGIRDIPAGKSNHFLQNFPRYIFFPTIQQYFLLARFFTIPRSATIMSGFGHDRCYSVG